MVRPILALAFLASTAVAQGGRGGRAGAVTVKPGEACPAGMTEIRPRSCMAPEFPAPSIVDYRPRSTLVVGEHKMRMAKFPVIDFHAHIRGLLGSQQGMDSLVAAIDSLNVKLMVAADNVTGEQLTRLTAAVEANPKLKGRVRFMTGISLQSVGPGWAERVVAQLEADVKAGAVGIGEIGKGFGMSTRKADGSRLKIDDPELDPVWAAAARLRVPVFIHTAEPQEFFGTLDYNNERWLELALFADRRNGADRSPAFDTLMTERDNLFRKHPKTTFVAAHMGWHANDLGRLGKMFDAMPNVHAELGAVLYDIGRQPRAANAFFVKYQDRILFGKDSFQPEEYPYYWRVFETTDDYFDYYRDYHAFWKLYGIGLPDQVLKKVYSQNALKLMPAISKDGWK